MFVSTFIGALVIGISNGLRNCNDCTEVTKCREALNIFLTDKSKAGINMLIEAHCGEMKVCCSDFINNQGKPPTFNARGGFEKDNQLNDEDEIANHPNVYLLPDECGKIDGDRIIGGMRAKMNEYPWLALISIKVGGQNRFSCGGTVINERYVLTAAHCIRGQDIAGVRIGEYDISSKNDCSGFGTLRRCQSYLQNIAVSQTILHPDYKRKPSVLNDIALLRLWKPVNLTVANAGAICLPLPRSLRDMNIASEIGIAAGWGITENKTASEILLKVELPIYDQEMCKKLWNDETLNNRIRNVFCAGERDRDSCRGDSGGPLMLEAPYKDENYRLIQFGIVSYGPRGECGSGIPGVYTDVRKFMKWILDTIVP